MAKKSFLIRNSKHSQKGFTLIEMAIALTIIGLAVGGVLVGRDVIRSATERAQIAQIEKYNHAVSTFFVKYHALPGDMDGATAAKYGFANRGTYEGQGDGNGVLEGYITATSTNYGVILEWGENATFWVDLTSANGLNIDLIQDTFTVGQPIQGNSCSCNVSLMGPPPSAATANTYLDSYFPHAKIGRGNYIYTWSGGPLSVGPGVASDQQNYFGILPITGLSATTGQVSGSNMGMTAKEASDIDRKVDDGLAQTGQVIAMYIAGNVSSWASNSTTIGATTCFNSTTGQYSTVSLGANVNCALSFQFQ